MVNTAEAWSERAFAEPMSWNAAGWTQDGQQSRFLKVLAELDPQKGDSLLDFGCGTGALLELLPSGIDYLGFDTSLGMVQRAQLEHPGARFQVWEPNGLFSLVACIGCFNLPGGWSKLRTWQTLRALWDRTGRAMAVSLYAGEDDRCLVYAEDECMKFAQGESYRRRVERWRPNDILVVLER